MRNYIRLIHPRGDGKETHDRTPYLPYVLCWRLFFTYFLQDAGSNSGCRGSYACVDVLCHFFAMYIHPKMILFISSTYHVQQVSLTTSPIFLTQQLTATRTPLVLDSHFLIDLASLIIHVRHTFKYHC